MPEESTAKRPVVDWLDPIAAARSIAALAPDQTGLLRGDVGRKSVDDRFLCKAEQ